MRASRFRTLHDNQTCDALFIFGKVSIASSTPRHTTGF